MKIKLLCLTLILSLLAACHSKESADTVKLGIIDGPSSILWEAAQKTAFEKYGLKIELVKFLDYNLPNEALNQGDIDANAFQHKPFLDAQVAAHGYSLIPIANTFLYPIALYSTKIRALTDIPNQAKIAIPNDPSNEARALLLLQNAGFLRLRAGADLKATPIDIITNPKQLKIVELDAAQLPRVLYDVTAAVITNDYAQPAGLDPHKALLVESKDSPYMNIIVIRTDKKDDAKIQNLIKAFQTPETIALAEKISNGNAIAGW